MVERDFIPEVILDTRKVLSKNRTKKKMPFYKDIFNLRINAVVTSCYF